MLMSILRYLKVCHPIKDNILNQNHVIGFVFLTYVYSAIWTLGPLIGWASYGIEPWKLTCSIDWTNITTSYLICCFVACYLLPLLCIIGFYSRITIVVGNFYRSRRVLSHRDRNRYDQHMLKLTVGMSSAFFLAWTPYAIVSFMSSLNMQTISIAATPIPAIFAKSSTVYNPIVYYLMIQRFRDEIWQLLCSFRLSKKKVGGKSVEEMRQEQDEMKGIMLELLKDVKEMKRGMAISSTDSDVKKSSSSHIGKQLDNNRLLFMNKYIKTEQFNYNVPYKFDFSLQELGD
ncbi:DgyrCDS13587 [Dimorphilus gyrociliatus]|uniref:DgyrCDS13587 n=1 Tax=Dimorphilus gyrociliatus TaxID=2664684 RepID=A0A7I8WB52_9ANNE|nr:DgyrCDS13587 [Dimorphilus gyrociliatus]